MYDFRIRGKIFELTWRECYIQLGTFQRSRVSLLEPWQINLSNPEVYSEPCKKSMMVLFAEKSQGLKTVNYFC